MGYERDSLSRLDRLTQDEGLVKSYHVTFENTQKVLDLVRGMQEIEGSEDEGPAKTENDTEEDHDTENGVQKEAQTSRSGRRHNLVDASRSTSTQEIREYSFRELK